MEAVVHRYILLNLMFLILHEASFIEVILASRLGCSVTKKGILIFIVLFLLTVALLFSVEVASTFSWTLMMS